jgi:hypothetical protein
LYACLLLLALITFEVIAVRWWLRREWLPPLFNGWAVLIYTALLAVDFTLVWLISIPFSTTGDAEFRWLPAVGIIMVVLVFVFTLFFKWVVRQDIIEPPSDTSK